MANEAEQIKTLVTAFTEKVTQTEKLLSETVTKLQAFEVQQAQTAGAVSARVTGLESGATDVKEKLQTLKV